MFGHKVQKDRKNNQNGTKKDQKRQNERPPASPEIDLRPSGPTQGRRSWPCALIETCTKLGVSWLYDDLYRYDESLHDETEKGLCRGCAIPDSWNIYPGIIAIPSVKQRIPDFREKALFLKSWNFFSEKSPKSRIPELPIPPSLYKRRPLLYPGTPFSPSRCAYKMKKKQTSFNLSAIFLQHWTNTLIPDVHVLENAWRDIQER